MRINILIILFIIFCSFTKILIADEVNFNAKKMEIEDNGNKVAPDSIIDICRKNKLKDFFLVDDSMGGFLEAYTNSKENKLKLIYGLRLTVCADMLTKNEESLSSNKG